MGWKRAGRATTKDRKSAITHITPIAPSHPSHPEAHKSLKAPKALNALNALKALKALFKTHAPALRAPPLSLEGDNFEFWQMRVSERKGCLLASKGSKEQSAIGGQQSAVSGQQSANCPSCSLRPFLPSQTPQSLCASSCSARPPSAISTTPPSLPYRRGGVLGGATQRLWLSLLFLRYLF